ncbi:hypothetical protein [Gordonia sp. CPCC 205333]|uniref:hypothetical protein n=1 Tax=Gordonia sp. CPCC 205333 TaxID=3140790 RepID=UPI003AF3FBD8
MIRQSAGFALLGSLLALLGAAVFQGHSSDGYATYFIGGGSNFGDWGYLEVAVGGAILGLVIGATLWFVGLRTSGSLDNRIARVTAAGLLGTTVGMSPTLVLVSGAFNDATRDAPIFVIYPVSAVLAYVLALAAVFIVLRIAGDESATATTKTTAAILPIGGVIATLTGVGAAYRFSYSTSTPTWIVVFIVVVLVLAATFGAGRALAIRD